MEHGNLAAGLAALPCVRRRRFAALLRGERPTLPLIRLLVDPLGVSADVLVRDPAGSAA